MSEQVLTFKFQRNRQIDIMTGGSYAPPFTNQRVKINGHETVTPVFNMDYVHSIALHDETPQIPERDGIMSDRLYEELKDEAYREAMQNRRKNDQIRNRLRKFEKSGTIKVLEDPFARKTAPDKAAAKSEPKPKPDKAPKTDSEAA